MMWNGVNIHIVFNKMMFEYSTSHIPWHESFRIFNPLWNFCAFYMTNLQVLSFVYYELCFPPIYLFIYLFVFNFLAFWVLDKDDKLLCWVSKTCKIWASCEREQWIYKTGHIKWTAFSGNWYLTTSSWS